MSSEVVSVVVDEFMNYLSAIASLRDCAEEAAALHGINFV